MNRLAMMVVLATTVSCKKKVDTADFEARLMKRTEQLGLVGATVSCPKGVEAKQGASFECSVSVGGRSYVLVATITSVDGKQLGMDSKWKDGEAVINTKLAPALSDDLSKQFGTAVNVDCGKDTLLFIDKDRNVTCDLAAGETRAKVLVTFDDKLVPKTWKLDPLLVAKQRLETFLEAPVRAKTSPNVTIHCGDKPLLPRPADGLVWCEVAEGDKKAKIKVAVDEELKIKGWELAP